MKISDIGFQQSKYKGNNPSAYKERGYRDNQKNEYNVTREFDPQLRGIQGYKVFEQMRHDDPLVGGFFRAFTSIIKSANYFVTPAIVSEENQEQANAVAALVKKGLLTNPDLNLKDFMACAADNAATYGFSAFEIVLDRDDNDNTIVRKLALRPAHTIQSFDLDDRGDLRGIYQQGFHGDFVYLPTNKLILTTFDGSNGMLVGRSLLRNAYRPYYDYTNLQQLMQIMVEREAVGLPHITVPEPYMRETATEEQLAVVAGLVEQMTAFKADQRACVISPSPEFTDESGVVKKTGFSFEVIRSGGARSINALEMIKDHKQELLISLLGEFLLLGSGGGSYSLAEAKNSLFLLSIEGMLSQIIQQINRQLIPMLVKLNGYDIEMAPKLEYDNIRQESLQTLTNFLSSMANAGLLDQDDPQIRDHIRILGSLPASQEELEAEVNSEEYITVEEAE